MKYSELNPGMLVNTPDGIGIVVKSDWIDYYVEGRPIKIVETERVHLSNNGGLDIIHACDVELV